MSGLLTLPQGVWQWLDGTGRSIKRIADSLEKIEGHLARIVEQGTAVPGKGPSAGCQWHKPNE